MTDVPFVWTDCHQSCSEEQKRPNFSSPDPDKPIELHTNAFAVGVGSVLIQKTGEKKHVIAYASKILNKAQKNYGATKLLKLLAIVLSIERFYYYFGGDRPSKIVPGIWLLVHH